MKRRSRLAASLLLVCLSLSCRGRHVTPPADAAASSSSAELAPPAPDAQVTPVNVGRGTFVALAQTDGGRVAFVADEDDGAVLAVDLEKNQVVARAALDAAPGQLALGPDGTVFVAVRGAARAVALRLRKDMTFRTVVTHETGDEPYGVTLSPDGATLWVTTIRGARLEGYRASDLAPTSSVGLARDPRSVLVAADGARAFVAHASGSAVSVVELSAGEPRGRTVALDMKERRRDFGMLMTGKPPPPRFVKMAPPSRVNISMTRKAQQGFGLAAIGDDVLLPDTLVLTGSARISTGYGTSEASTLDSHVPFVQRVRASDGQPTTTVFSGPDDRACFEGQRACLLPRAVAEDGARLYVACLDSDEILVVDPKADTEHAPACKKALKDRLRLGVERPTGVAVDRERGQVIAFSSFTRRLTLLSAEGGTAGVVVDLPRVGAAPSSAVAAGRKLFHETRDRRISGDGRACASCHVDGREDGLVWPTPTGARQTPMLAGRIEGTGPYGWSGEHASLPVHIKATIKNLGGKGLPDEDLERLAAYVASMRAPSRRAPLSAAAQRGRLVFESEQTECSTCHVERSRFTDGDAHALDRGSRTRFDTPSLAFVGQTAPYFHDGRYATLEALVDKCDGVMGHTKHLTEPQRADLVAFLRTL